MRINAPLSFGMRVLPQLVEVFRLAYPRIEVEIHLTDAFFDSVEADCDLAIHVSGPPTDKSTIWRKLCEVPRFLVAPPELFNRIPRPTTPEALDRNMLLSYSADGRAETWELQSKDRKTTVRAGRQVVSNNGDFLYGLACCGGGICLLPEFLVRDGLASGAVERVLPEWSPPSLWLTLYYPPYERLPPLVGTFTDFFEDYIRDLDGMEVT